jgi:hypothetical protein
MSNGWDVDEEESEIASHAEATLRSKFHSEESESAGSRPVRPRPASAPIIVKAPPPPSAPTTMPPPASRPPILKRIRDDSQSDSWGPAILTKKAASGVLPVLPATTQTLDPARKGVYRTTFSEVEAPPAPVAHPTPPRSPRRSVPKAPSAPPTRVSRRSPTTS